MNSNDDLTAVSRSLTALRDSLGHARLDRPVETVFSRAAARRRRRLLSAAGAVAAAGGAGLALSPAGPAASPPAAGRAVHANLAAWSVNTNPDGTVTLTVRQWLQAGALRAALRRAGVPAVISVGEFCEPAGPGLPEITRVITRRRPAGLGSGPLEWIIHPAAMPKGTELDFGYRSGDKAGLMLGLVPASSRLTCRRLRSGPPSRVPGMPAARRAPADGSSAGPAGQSPAAGQSSPPAPASGAAG